MLLRRTEFEPPLDVVMNSAPRALVFWNVPPLEVNEPVRLLTLMPLLPPFAETLVKESVPLLLESKNAVPVVVATATSLTLTPVIAPAGSFIPVFVVELIPSPRTVALVFSVTVLPMFVIVPFALFITGNAALPLGGVNPVIVASVAVASW